MMTEHFRQFTRPLLLQITEHPTSFVELLAGRAENDGALARHMVAALASLAEIVELPENGKWPSLIAEN